MPEARQALDNGVFQLVVAPISSDAGARAKCSIPTKGGEAIEVIARVPGIWANGILVKVSGGNDRSGKEVFDLELCTPKGDLLERHRGISSSKSLVTELEGSTVVRIDPNSDGFPQIGKYHLRGGEDAAPDAYRDALVHLNSEPDVDMVLAAAQDFSQGNLKNILEIYSDVISHCKQMSDETYGRIGFGQVLQTGASSDHSAYASHLRSERFVLVAPTGIVGAVAGRVGDLGYYESPTFKSIVGVGSLEPSLSVEDQRALLQESIVPIVRDRERGAIVLRGLTTDGDQINVRRIADRAVRTLKMIGERFIGRLNTSDGRDALKQKLVEALLQMVRDGALVPSTDGTDPAFKVDVYSSQQDFALGIVRVDMAVRPVRAIDYIYATVLVQV